jgi:hypothetical protein
MPCLLKNAIYAVPADSEFLAASLPSPLHLLWKPDGDR